MNKPERLFWITRPDLVKWPLFFMVCISASVHAVPYLEGLSDDQVTVRELMRLDADLALKLARERGSGLMPAVDRPQRVSRTMSGEPRLAAIYGVGRTLMAEVVMDHMVYLYRHGQALPVGVAPGDEVYLLSTISTSCIEITKSDDSHHLCLRPKQWVGK